MGSTNVLQQIEVDRWSPVPIYHQMSEGFRALIQAGTLAPGDPLPTVSRMAAHYGTSTSTVMRAVDKLAADGMVVTRRGARTCVRAQSAPSTEMLFPKQTTSARILVYLDQLLEGLRQGYGQSSRRFWTTYLDDVHNADELLGIFQLRATDSMVIYRPTEPLIPILQQVAAAVPTVSLFYPIPDAPADTVLADPVTPLTDLLQKRLAAGQRHFAYVGGKAATQSESAQHCPYRTTRECFANTMRRANIEPLWFETDCPDANAAAKIAKKIPAGSVLVADHPQLSLLLDPDSTRFDAISYTECRSTLDLVRGKVTTLYLGLEALGGAATSLLVKRSRDSRMRKPRQLRLQPQVIVSDAAI